MTTDFLDNDDGANEELFSFLYDRTGDPEHLRSCMLFYVAEVGRETSVDRLDAVCDKYAIESRKACETSPFAELPARRKMCAELVAARVLEAVTNIGGEVCGWRMTAPAVQFLINADCELPKWLEDLRA